MHGYTHTHTHTHTEKEHTHTNSKPCNHEISVTVVLYTKVIQLTLMSCHCSVEVSTGCTGAAGPFLSGGTYTGGLYTRVATLVCLGFAFLVFSVFLGKHSPTSASGTQTAQFVCRCIVISEAQWVVPVPDSFFLEITVVKYKSGEFVLCQNPRVSLSVFFSPVVCLLERYHVVTRIRLRLSALIHL